MDPHRWRTVEELYHAATNREVAERAVFLDEACGGDLELRQEVESLLAEDARIDRFLEIPAWRAAALTPGTRIGPYEILALLGEGGMGEVYRATDTRLDRTVAIKVLPLGVARDSERRQRFEREAKAVASLNHPNICTLHEFDRAPTDEGVEVDFLVMEHLEGETLADRLLREAAPSLPLSESLSIAIQIADALAIAHEHGVVHRDLKPGNIMLTKAGSGGAASPHVKLLDFGLAKLRAPSLAAATPSVATASTPLTGEGIIVGTLPYMAPEQLEGKEADTRTDLFALGAIVYEMVTGRRAFEGESQASLIAAILEHDPPPLVERNPLAPPALERLVRTCLAKGPEDRWHDAHDLADELRRIPEDSGARQLPGAQASKSSPQPGSWRRALPWGTGALLAVLAAAALWDALYQPAHFEILLESGQELVTSPSVPLAISPDGSRVIYTTQAVGDASSSGRTQLYVYDVTSSSAQPIPGTEGAESPFFSPNGEWIGFQARGTLFRFQLGGTAPLSICDTSFALTGASWGADDTIVFGVPGEGLRQVPVTGGNPEVLTTPDRGQGEMGHGYPQILHDGEQVLFTIATVEGAGANRLGRLSLATGDWSRLETLGPAGQARYLQTTGHLVFVQRGSLLAVPFDLDRAEARGEPAPVLADLLTTTWLGFDIGGFAVSEAGTLVYVPAGEGMGESELVWVNREGRATTPVLTEPAEYRHPRLSRDATTLAVTWVSSEGTQVWVHDLRRGNPTLLTPEGWSLWPVWTPDGSRVVYAAARSDSVGWDLYWRPADASGPEQPLLTLEGDQYPQSWTPDGEALAFLDDTDGRNRVRILTMSDRQVRTLATAGVGGGFSRFSPDGQWLAYSSTESGRREVDLRPYPDAGRRWTVSADGGTAPVWSADGTELFYRDGARLMAVEVETGSTFPFSAPRELFKGRYGHNPYGGQNYDVAPDGRFVMVQNPSGPTQVNVMLDWFEHLGERVPVR